MKRKQFRDRIQVLISVERDRWSEFVDQCDKERKSSSLKIDEMLVGELQKNPLGEEIGPRLSPLANIERHQRTNKRFQLKAANDKDQSHISEWLPRTQAIKMAKTAGLSHSQWDHLGVTCHIIARKIKTGYL